MPQYQHYSFDLWLTLIKSNPLFKQERTRIFHRDFNGTGKSLEEVGRIFRQVDLMCNAVNERTGKNVDADEMYLMVISQMNDNTLNLYDVNVDKLYTDMEELLYTHMPLIYGPHTIDVLDRLRAREGVTMNILSNTGFIKGQTLRKVLVSLGLHSYFDFQIYSDEEGLSKPSPALFNFLVASARLANKQKDIHLADIMHVGDNPITDTGGAKAAGISTMLINSNNVCISNLLA